jgi:glycosyltransferase involved in cell wall biosynthesis
MPESILFSIIIPTFNSAETLPIALNSILQQNYNKFEVLIMDGASKDRTVEIANEYRDHRIRIFSEKDNGIYDAMNKGISKSSGKWLFFLGSDDYLYDSGVLTDVYSQTRLHPESRMLFGDIYTSSGLVQRFNKVSFYELTQHNICHQAIFYHASLFNQVRYDLAYKLMADWDFNLKIFQKKNYPVYFKRLVAVYNMNGASLNWTITDEYRNHFADRQKLFIKHKGLFSYLLFRLKIKFCRLIKGV